MNDSELYQPAELAPEQLKAALFDVINPDSTTIDSIKAAANAEVTKVNGSGAKTNRFKNNVGNELYSFIELLGEGSFCKVYKALYKSTQELIAVKVIKRKRVSSQDAERMILEAELLGQLDHQNIVKYKHIHQHKGKVFLGMELVQGGRLTDLIKQRFQSHEGRFTDRDASALMKGILSAVEYMHEKGIVHRDLKPDNILISTPSDLSTCKVVDFGLSAKYKQTEGGMDQQCGTVIYMAPEVVVHNHEYTKSVDIFATGIIMFEMITGGKHPLYLEKEDSVESYKRKLAKIDGFNVPSEQFSWLASNLFSNLTKIQSRQRYTAKQALQHPWITRKNEGHIPMSLNDHITSLPIKQALKEKMLMMFFLSVVKDSNQSNSRSLKFISKNLAIDYREKCDLVVKKIDKWHARISLKKQGSFVEDRDFVEIGNSPNRFDHDSSDEEEGRVYDQDSKNNDAPTVSAFNIDTQDSESNGVMPANTDGGLETSRERKSQTFSTQILKLNKLRDRNLFINSKVANKQANFEHSRNKTQRVGSSLPATSEISPEKSGIVAQVQSAYQKTGPSKGPIKFNYQKLIQAEPVPSGGPASTGTAGSKVLIPEGGVIQRSSTIESEGVASTTPKQGSVNKSLERQSISVQQKSYFAKGALQRRISQLKTPNKLAVAGNEEKQAQNPNTLQEATTKSSTGNTTKSHGKHKKRRKTVYNPPQNLDVKSIAQQHQLLVQQTLLEEGQPFQLVSRNGQSTNYRMLVNSNLILGTGPLVQPQLLINHNTFEDAKTKEPGSLTNQLVKFKTSLYNQSISSMIPQNVQPIQQYQSAITNESFDSRNKMISNSLSTGAYVVPQDNRMFVRSNLPSKRKAEILENETPIAYTSANHPYKVKEENGYGFRTTTNLLGQEVMAFNEGEYLNSTIRGGGNEVKLPLIQFGPSPTKQQIQEYAQRQLLHGYQVYQQSQGIPSKVISRASTQQASYQNPPTAQTQNTFSIQHRSLVGSIKPVKDKAFDLNSNYQRPVSQQPCNDFQSQQIPPGGSSHNDSSKKCINQQTTPSLQNGLNVVLNIQSITPTKIVLPSPSKKKIKTAKNLRNGHHNEVRINATEQKPQQIHTERGGLEYVLGNEKRSPISITNVGGAIKTRNFLEIIQQQQFAALNNTIRRSINYNKVQIQGGGQPGVFAPESQQVQKNLNTAFDHIHSNPYSRVYDSSSQQPYSQNPGNQHSFRQSMHQNNGAYQMPIGKESFFFYENGQQKPSRPIMSRRLGAVEPIDSPLIVEDFNAGPSTNFQSVPPRGGDIQAIIHQQKMEQPQLKLHRGRSFINITWFQRYLNFHQNFKYSTQSKPSSAILSITQSSQKVLFDVINTLNIRIPALNQVSQTLISQYQGLPYKMNQIGAQIQLSVMMAGMQGGQQKVGGGGAASAAHSSLQVSTNSQQQQQSNKQKQQKLTKQHTAHFQGGHH